MKFVKYILTALAGIGIIVFAVLTHRQVVLALPILGMWFAIFVAIMCLALWVMGISRIIQEH